MIMNPVVSLSAQPATIPQNSSCRGAASGAQPLASAATSTADAIQAASSAEEVSADPANKTHPRTKVACEKAAGTPAEAPETEQLERSTNATTSMAVPRDPTHKMYVPMSDTHGGSKSMAPKRPAETDAKRAADSPCGKHPKRNEKQECESA